MRRSNIKWFVLFFVSLFVASVAAAPASVPDEKLAELGYKIKAEVEAIVRFQLKDRQYVDNRHLIIPDGSSVAFLVTTVHPCRGMSANRITARTRDSKNLSLGDKLQIKHEGRTVDHCEIERIQKLESL